LPLLETAGFAECYDLAIMSTKGVSNTSARRLVDILCSQYQVPLLVLRDFDRAGFIIASTLQRDTRRYTFHNRIKVIDLGLRQEDAQCYNLDSEAVYEMMSYHKLQAQLRGNGATEAEIQFLVQGQRVELNAFTSDQFVEWVNGKLDELQL
jgi:DNA topoisomerase VI subunit A